MRAPSIFLIVLLALAALSCGGDSPTDPGDGGNNSGMVSIALTPSSANVPVGMTQQFTASVSGTDQKGVTWSVLEGASHGTINPAGLYTAPPVLPNPAMATIRVRSAADTARTATAVVTLVSPGGLTAEQSLVQQSYSAGFAPTELATNGINTLVEAVAVASELNGGSTLILTGTLTQTAAGGSEFTYAAQPADHFVVALAGFPPIHYYVESFEGYVEGTWEDFRDYHSDLRFRAQADGIGDIQVASASGNPGLAPKPAPAAVRNFERTVTGTVIIHGASVTVDIRHAGQVVFEVDASFADYQYSEETTGSAESASGSVTIAERYDSHLIFNSSEGRLISNHHRYNENTAILGGHTYRFQNVYVRRESENGFVSEPDYWLAQGTVTKNGQLFGTVRFDGPVSFGTPGPATVLELATGAVVPF